MQDNDTHGKSVRAIPKDYGSLTPFVIVHGVAKFLDFLQEAFAAQERTRVPNEDGTIGHAEVWIGNRVLMMFDAKEDWSPTPAFLMIYVEDCDAVHRKALAAGAEEITKLATNAWGDRGSRIRDPFGNIWWIQTHVEDVSEEEIGNRMGQPEYLADMEDSTVTLERAMQKSKTS